MKSLHQQNDSIFDVVGIGRPCLDDLMLLPHYPAPDEKVEMIDSIRQIGGPAPIGMKTLSVLGMKTSFISKIGSDAHGEFMKQKLIECGVDISFLKQEQGSLSQFSSIWVDVAKGTRAISNSNGTISPVKREDFPSENDLPPCKLLHIDGREHDIIKNIISSYKQKFNTLVSIDTGNFRERTLELLPLVDIIIMPKRFAVAAFQLKLDKDVDFINNSFKLEELIEIMRNDYQNSLAIVITDGANGSISSFFDKSESKCNVFAQKAFSVKVLDTTGAGDCHSGALIYGFLKHFHNSNEEEKKEWNIRHILRFAAGVAAFKCMGMGNSKLPTLQEALQFIEQ